MLIRSGEEEKRKQKRYIWCKTLAWTVSIFIEFTSTHNFYILGDKRLPSTTDLLRRRVFPDSFIPSLASSLRSLRLSFFRCRPRSTGRDCPPPSSRKGWRRGLAALLGEILIGLLRDAGSRRIESAGNPADNRVSFVNENRPDCTLHSPRVEPGIAAVNRANKPEVFRRDTVYKTDGCIRRMD